MYGFGGAAQTAWSPFVGGCPGGAALDVSGNVASAGGRGGGGIQMSSFTRISLGASSLVDLGGGGGGSFGGGGGAAGNMILEAPVVDIAGAVYMNGGAGGGCSLLGDNGTRSLDAARAGGSCGPHNATGGGSGGTAQQPPGIGRSESSTGGGGGGGAAGRVKITSRDGTVASTGATLDALVEVSTLNPR